MVVADGGCRATYSVASYLFRCLNLCPGTVRRSESALELLGFDSVQGQVVFIFQTFLSPLAFRRAGYQFVVRAERVGNLLCDRFALDVVAFALHHEPVFSHID